ncbi:RNA 2'-phosphotransferase [Saccharibacillus sacchari]|uniref:RNA 2'-phosphotransferase n=1 Tax=Saccharibacillus sacchari TaxID=456493 RepID=A0ACC6PHM0_9BACL
MSKNNKNKGGGNPYRGQSQTPKLSIAERDKKISKLMSMMLRHSPEDFGLTLDPEDGSCRLDELLAAVRKRTGYADTTEQDIRDVVRRSDKQRFEILESTDGVENESSVEKESEPRIRARYGHSFGRVTYPQGTPPTVLYHGTGRQALPSIEEHGLLPMGREYVHLSAETSFAALAGRRKGKLIMLNIDSVAATNEGIVFYDAGSGVWLAERIPSNLIKLDETYEDKPEPRTKR